MKLVIAFLAICVSACAQVVPPSGDFSHLPAYLVGIGGAANPGAAVVTLAVRIGSTNFYSRTALDTPFAQQNGQRIVSTARTGIAYVAAHSGSCFLFFLGDAGASLGSGFALGAFSAGGGVFCNSARFPHVYAGPILRAEKINASQVAPTAEFLVNWSF